jgi:transcriptional regulator GlxA family with amidase domain
MAAFDVGILLYEGFEELSALIPHAVFDAAAAECDLSVTTYSLVPSQTIAAASGLEVAPDDVLIGTPDLVLVPGGPWEDGTAPGARAAAEAGEYPDRIATLAEGGADVAALSTGVLLLGEAGLLEDRSVASPAGYREAVASYGATVEDASVVADGDLVTAGSAAMAFDLALHLVARECGEATAGSVAESVGYDRMPVADRD